MLANILGGFITIVVATALMPIVANNVYYVTHNTTGGTKSVNITGASLTILNLTTLFFAMAIMATGISITVQALKQSGIM